MGSIRDNIPLRTKFVITFVTFVLLPILLLNLILATVQYNSKLQEYTTTHKYMMSDVPDTLYSNFDFALSFINVIYKDHDINDFLNTTFTDATDFYDKYSYYDIIKIIDFYAAQSENIQTPVIYTANPTVYGSTACLSRIDTNKVVDASWYKAFVESGKDTFIFFDEETRYASIIRTLDNNKMARFNHFIKIDIDLEYVTRGLEETGTPCVAYLFGDTSTPIYTWDSGYTPTQKTSDYALLEKDTVGEDLCLVFSQNVDYYGSLRFIVVMKKMDFLSRDLIFSTVLPLLVTLLASLLFMQYMQRNYIKRIESLVSAIDINEYINNTSSDADVPKRRKKKSNNELAIVEETMEEMSAKIHALIKESYDLEMEKNQAEIRRKQSELNSLLSQINPHYLFNVLNAIRLKSIIKGEKETAKIILYVSKIMRQSITWNEDVISLSEELNFIKEYLAIEKYRFEDKLNYEINISEDANLCEIPKMCLQPFVENACVHGIQNVIGSGTITIDVKKTDEDHFEFSITNPKVDFSEEKKQMILGYYHGNFNVDTKSVGLKNTFARLRYYYDDFGFDIVSDDENVTFTLVLPVHTDRRKAKDDNVENQNI